MKTQNWTNWDQSYFYNESQFKDSIQCSLTDDGPSFNPVFEQRSLEVIISQATRFGDLCILWIFLLVLTHTHTKRKKLDKGCSLNASRCGTQTIKNSWRLQFTNLFIIHLIRALHLSSAFYIIYSEQPQENSESLQPNNKRPVLLVDTDLSDINRQVSVTVLLFDFKVLYLSLPPLLITTPECPLWKNTQLSVGLQLSFQLFFNSTQ